MGHHPVLTCCTSPEETPKPCKESPGDFGSPERGGEQLSLPLPSQADLQPPTDIFQVLFEFPELPVPPGHQPGPSANSLGFWGFYPETKPGKWDFLRRLWAHSVCDLSSLPLPRHSAQPRATRAPFPTCHARPFRRGKCFPIIWLKASLFCRCVSQPFSCKSQ